MATLMVCGRLGRSVALRFSSFPHVDLLLGLYYLGMLLGEVLIVMIRHHFGGVGQVSHSTLLVLGDV